MTFAYNPQINYVTFLQFELIFFVQPLPKHIDTGYLMNATPPTITFGSF